MLIEQKSKDKWMMFRRFTLKPFWKIFSGYDLQLCLAKKGCLKDIFNIEADLDLNLHKGQPSIE